MSYTINNGETSDGIIFENDRMTVLEGGTVNNTTVNSGGWLYVSSGGTANGTTLNDSGRMYLSRGGTASNTTAGSGGMFYVFGTADSTTVNPGGGLYVSSGGTANSTAVNSGGKLTVYSGGTAIDIAAVSGACLVFDVAPDTYIAGTDDGSAFAIEGGKVSHYTVNNGGRLTVYSGSTATDIVENGGFVYFEEGADVTFAPNTINDLLLKNASATIHSGTTANRATVNSRSDLNIISGGSANRPTVNSGGRILVGSGGTATEIVENGGYVHVGDGADVTFVPNTINDLVLEKVLSATVHSGTTANRTTVNFSGYLHVSSGGTANNTTVNPYGKLYVSSGGTATDTTVNNGGWLYVSNDGTATDTTVNDGGGLYVSSGGTANNTTVYLGWLHVCGSANNTTVNDGGTLYVSSGGTANITTVNDGGGLHVSSGGTANITTVNDGGYVVVSSGGTANITTVNDGSTLCVSSGGTALGIVTVSGAYLVFDVAPDTYIEGTYDGSAFEIKDGAVSNFTVNDGCTLCVSSGGTATEIIENGGFVLVEDGADVTFVTHTINDLLLERASATIHSGTTAVNTTVATAGRLHVFSGGTADRTTVNSRGTLFVSSGGTAMEIMENGGFVLVEDGADVTFVTHTINDLLLERASATIHSGTTANNTTISSTRFNVFSGGTANNTTVKSGGSFTVSSGGSADNTTVENGGSMFVSSGGMADRTTVSSGGRLYVSGGMADRTTLSSGGSLFVLSGGMADNTMVFSGGRLYVSGGGTANITTLSSGGSITVSSGGTATVTGKTSFDALALVSMDKWAVLDFDLTQADPVLVMSSYTWMVQEHEKDAFVNDISVIRGTPRYTLTVNRDLKLNPGVGDSYGYILLGHGAESFNGTISVVDETGDAFGTLAVDKTVVDNKTIKVGYDTYKLHQLGSMLVVTVEAPDLTPQAPVGTQEKVSWETTGANEYVIEYSTDNFEHVIRVETAGNAIDMPDLPAGTYQWRVKADGNSEWAVGEEIVSAEPEDNAPKVVQAVEDGSDDLFFASANGTWGQFYYALHVGSIGDWTGTNELVSAEGKDRIQNLFFGSDDPNVLCLTDADNGDAIFVDDAYTGLPEEVEANTARLYKIQEIRAGAGDDIVDMTSQRCEYTGDGLTIRGGDGDDVIWANKGNNMLFGDAGNDRIVGASGNDVIAGGIGSDSMHGGGGNDVFAFCDNWGADTVEQLETGTVTLWFASGDESNWNAETLTYTDGENSVKVSGVTDEQVTLKFGSGETPEDADRFASLSGMGVFDAFTSRRVFEESGTGILASL